MSPVCLQRNVTQKIYLNWPCQGCCQPYHVTVRCTNSTNVLFHQGEKKKSKLSKWPSSVFLCGRSSIWRNLCRPCSCCLTYSVVIHLCHITPGLVDAACCSSFIQSVLRGWVCVDLGRSPGCLLLHWDRSRSPQTQFEIIKRLLVEMCDHTQDTGVHSFSQKLQASLNSFQFSNLLSIRKHTHLHPPLRQRERQSPSLLTLPTSRRPIFVSV